MYKRQVYDELAQELKEKLDDERAMWKDHYDKITETTEEAAARIAEELAKETAEAARVTEENLAKAAKAAEDSANRMVAAAARSAAAFANIGGPLGMGSALVGPAGLGEILSRRDALIAASDPNNPLSAAAAMQQATASVNASIQAAIPSKAHGGFIGGREGAPSLAMVHGGELVLNRAQQAGMGNTINVTINGNVDDPQTMARLIAQEVDAVIGRNAVRNEQLRSR